VKSQYGFLLVTAIFLLVILAALGAFILTISGTQQTSSALDVQGTRAYQAARAGIEWASYQVLINPGGCAGYTNERSVTINHTKVPNTDQSNFPVLFSGTYAGGGGSLDLRTVGNGGKVTNASGFDIIFTDSAGTKLDHEIESYSATTGAVNFWVRVPTVSHTTDTVIYLCYGNAAITTTQENKTGVWNSNFKMVQHLEETSGTHLDSTSNANNSTVIAVTTQGSATGKINGTDAFTAASLNHVDVGSSAMFDVSTIESMTVEAWVKTAGTGGYEFVVNRKTDANSGWQLHINVSNPEFWFYDDTPGTAGHKAQANSATAVNNNAFHYLVARWTAGTKTAEVFIDGASGASATAASVGAVSNTRPLRIGEEGDTNGGFDFDGIIDEVRFSKTALSNDWILTSYNSMNSPSTFYTLGAESAAGSSYATDCNPGPTTQNVTGMGGTLSGFTAAVTCSSTAFTEGGATVTVYQITSTGAQGTVGTLDRVERQLQATLNK
jgi:MSHA biogenesis protein MshP